MKNQTMKNDPINSGDEGHSEMKEKLCSLWLGVRDSNPRSRDQNPLPYRLANSQCCDL